MSKLIGYGLFFALLLAAIFAIVAPTSYVVIMLLMQDTVLPGTLRDIGFWQSMNLSFTYAAPGLLAYALFQWCHRRFVAWAKNTDVDDDEPKGGPLVTDGTIKAENITTGSIRATTILPGKLGEPGGPKPA